MKNFVPAVALAFCVLHPDLATAAVSLDPTTNVLTDSEAGRMWVLDGIGFCCSYAFPGFANDWVGGLNRQSFAGHADWRLPTVVAPTNGNAPPKASGELGQLFLALTAAYPDRNDWPFGLGATDYGGRIIYSDEPVPTLQASYWGLNFGDGEYKGVNVNNAYAWVGVMAVRPVPEPGTWALLLAGLAPPSWGRTYATTTELGSDLRNHLISRNNVLREHRVLGLEHRSQRQNGP